MRAGKRAERCRVTQWDDVARTLFDDSNRAGCAQEMWIEDGCVARLVSLFRRD